MQQRKRERSLSHHAAAASTRVSQHREPHVQLVNLRSKTITDIYVTRVWEAIQSSIWKVILLQ